MNRFKRYTAAILIALFSLTNLPLAAAVEGNQEQLISMDFEDAPLKNVLKILSQQSALNFVTSEGIESKKVTVYFEDVTVQDALDSIVSANDLRYEKKNESLYIIFPSQSISSGVETRVFYLKYTRLSASPIDVGGGAIISDLTAAQTVNAVTSSSSGSSDSGSSGSESSGGSSTSSSDSDTNKLTGRGIDTLVKSLLSKEGKLSADLNTNSLIVTDTPQKLKEIEDVLKQIDVSAKQVMIEVHVMEVRKNLLEDHGLDWGGDNGALASISGANRQTLFPFSNSALTDNTIVPNPTGLTYGVGTFSFSNLKATLRFITSDSHTKILARPRVLTMNNEAAEINLVTNTAISRSVVTTTSSGINNTTVTAERAPTGIVLKMTPQINEDGSINLYVEPSVTTATTSAFFPADFLDPTTRSVRTLARIMNNETLVLGGLIDSDESTAIKKIPGFGDVPIFGKAFSYKDKGAVGRELLIFITPHIVEGYSSLGPRSATAIGEEPSAAKVLNEFKENESERNLDIENYQEINRNRVIANDMGLYQKKVKRPETPGMDKEMTRSLDLFSAEPVRAGTK